MTKIYTNTYQYDYKVISNINKALNQMDDVINFNGDISPEYDCEERNGIYNYITDCNRIRNDISSVLEWANDSKNTIEKMEEYQQEIANKLPVREISKRVEFDI